MIKTLSEFLRRSLTENFGIKVLSLGFAIGLFAFLRGQEEEQHRTLPVGVVMRLPPEDGDRELMTQIPANIQVTLRGSSRTLDHLIQNGISPVEVDLRDGHKKTIFFEEDMFSLPPETRVTFIEPPSIDLAWENVIERQIPVQVVVAGLPAEGFVVRAQPEAEPAQITVRGPASVLEVMQHVRLAAFDVSGLTEGMHRRRIALDPPPQRVRYLGPTAISVVITVGRRMSEVTFKSRPVEVIGSLAAVAAPRNVDVTVAGPPEVVAALRPEQIVVRADLTQVSSLDLKSHGSSIVKLSVELARVEVEIQPPSVAVKW